MTNRSLLNLSRLAIVAIFGWGSWAVETAFAADHAAVRAAIESITADDARGYINFLADDTLEGRAAGSRGGHAAAHYLVDRMEKLGLKPAGEKDGFYQPFLAGDNNLLGMLEGSDPDLKQQIVLIGAHYDHVGYGSARNSYGPIGQIHNGADDNASGVAGLLEIIHAFTMLEPRPKRSILFAFWDGEEAGLLGSKHWVEHPTVPLKQVVMAINMDMIGRLRKEAITVYGTRSTPGLRRLVSEQNDLGLILDFNWDIRGDSDHSTFFRKGIPVLMPFTGLHNDYHRPTDDAEKINLEGMQRVAQLLFKCAVEIADRPTSFDFRKASTGESTWTRTINERLLPALPQRLGVGFDEHQATQGKVVINRVDFGSPAARAKLRARDRVLRVGDKEVGSLDEMRRAISTAPSPATFQIERAGEEKPMEIVVELVGEPARLGISWRADDAEPGAVMLNRVLPGSPAELAGLKPRDRIYRVAGHDFATADEFGQLVRGQTGPFDVTVETSGQLREATITPAEAKSQPSGAQP